MRKLLLAVAFAGALGMATHAQTVVCTALAGQTCEVSLSVKVTEAPPAPSPEPPINLAILPTHELPGMILESDWDMSGEPAIDYSYDDIPGSNGWYVAYNGRPGDVWGPEVGDAFLIGTPKGWLRKVDDPTAPISPGGVLDFTYPVGMVQGTAPSTVYRYWPIGRGIREMYVSFWWKQGAPFDFGTLGQKLAFMFNGGGGQGGQQFMALAPNGQIVVMPEYQALYDEPGRPRYRIRYPNVDQTKPAIGVWHKVEWYSNLNTGKNRWWLDGKLQGDYDDIDNTWNFDMFQFSPTWGGCCASPKTEQDHAYFDHVRLSVR